MRFISSISPVILKEHIGFLPILASKSLSTFVTAPTRSANGQFGHWPAAHHPSEIYSPSASCETRLAVCAGSRPTLGLMIYQSKVAAAAPASLRVPPMPASAWGRRRQILVEFHLKQTRCRETSRNSKNCLQRLPEHWQAMHPDWPATRTANCNVYNQTRTQDLPARYAEGRACQFAMDGRSDLLFSHERKRPAALGCRVRFGRMTK